MARYRKKPVIIEAEQWEPGKKIEGVRELTEGVFVGCGVIVTLEGEMMASPGDWIITGVKGEKYPCKPDIFEATYELVIE